MDSVVLIMFASVISTMTALSFIKLCRIRKKLEPKAEVRICRERLGRLIQKQFRCVGVRLRDAAISEVAG
jgi:hypothetical protein